MLSLVKTVLADSNGKGSQIGRGFRRECRDQAGVKTARQEHPDRYIGDDALANRGREQFVQPVDRLLLSDDGAAAWRQRKTPVTIDLDVAALGSEDAAGFELGDPAPARYGSGQIFVKQKPAGGIPVGCRLRKSGMALQ